MRMIKYVMMFWFTTISLWRIYSYFIWNDYSLNFALDQGR